MPIDFRRFTVTGLVLGNADTDVSLYIQSFYRDRNTGANDEIIRSTDDIIIMAFQMCSPFRSLLILRIKYSIH